tara:strand:+ start:348 stop:875 length:528 start_codon:yes stop_codon:yes gene_type:complete
MKRVIEGNLNSKMWITQIFMNHLIGRAEEGEDVNGSVVYVGSMTGKQPLSRIPAYSAAFAGVQSLTQSYGFIFGRIGIGRVNCVAVGFAPAMQNRAFIFEPDGETLSVRGEEIINGTATQRLLDPENIADAVSSFVDNERSRYCHGTTIMLSDGYNLVGLPNSSGLKPINQKQTE